MALQDEFKRLAVPYTLNDAWKVPYENELETLRYSPDLRLNFFAIEKYLYRTIDSVAVPVGIIYNLHYGVLQFHINTAIMQLPMLVVNQHSLTSLVRLLTIRYARHLIIRDMMLPEHIRQFIVSGKEPIPFEHLQRSSEKLDFRSK
jgi:hypothetical protein